MYFDPLSGVPICFVGLCFFVIIFVLMYRVYRNKNDVLLFFLSGGNIRNAKDCDFSLKKRMILLRERPARTLLK